MQPTSSTPGLKLVKKDAKPNAEPEREVLMMNSMVDPGQSSGTALVQTDECSVEVSLDRPQRYEHGILIWVGRKMHLDPSRFPGNPPLLANQFLITQ